MTTPAVARLLTLALALLAAVAPTRAHSVLESSVPADGAVVSAADMLSLTFAAEVRLATVRLVANNVDIALEVDRTLPPSRTFALPLPTLGPGRYTVKWSAIAEDAHVVSGGFSFAIAAHAADGAAGHEATPSSLNPWVVAATLVKAALYLSCLMAAGGAFFVFIFESLLQPAERRSIARLAGDLAFLALLLSLARLGIAAAALGDQASDMWDREILTLVMSGSEGTAFFVRTVGLVGILAAVEQTFVARLSLPLAALAAASFALTGHTVSLPPGELPQIAAALHLIAVAYWVGALVPLLRLTRTAELPRLASIAARFGNFALVAVGVLIAAGLFLIWALLDLPDGLVASDYGRLMVVKLALVSLLLALASFNKLRLTPRLRAGDGAAAVSLRRSTAAELALVVLIALTTAMFTTLTGPPNLH